MASGAGAYGGLRVAVFADTSKFAPAVTRAANSAGGQARAALGRFTSETGKDMGRTMSRAFDGVGKSFAKAAPSIGQSVGKLLGSGLNTVGRYASTAAEGAGKLIGSGLTKVGLPAIGRFAESAGGTIGRLIGRGFTGLGGIAERTGSILGRGLGKVFTGIGAAGGAVFRGIGTIATRTWELVSTGATKAFNTLSTATGVALAAGAGLLASTIKTGIAYNTLNQTSRAAFQTILGSGKAADQMMSDIREFAMTSPFPRQAFIEATRQMLGFGIETRKVIPYLGAIQDAVAATGGGAQQLSEITLIMSQIQAAGKITGVDLMQFAQRGINAAELIGSGMGKTGQQIKEAITAGSLDATKALDLLVKGMNQRFGGAAANVKKTWAGATDRIKGAMRDIGSAIVEPFISTAGGGLGIEWANKLADLLRALEPAVAPLIRTMTDKLAPIFSRISGLADRATAALKGMSVRQLTRELGDMAKVAGPLVGLFGAKGLGNLAGFLGPLGRLVPTLNPLVGLFVGLVATNRELRTSFMDIARNLARQVMPILRSLGNAIGPVLTTAVRALAPVFTVLGRAITRLGPVIQQLVAAFIGLLMPLLRQLGPILGTLARLFERVFADALNAIGPTLRMLGPLLSALGRTLGGFLMRAVRALAPVLATLGRTLSQALGQALRTLAPLWPTLMSALRQIFAAVQPLLPRIAQLAQVIIRILGQAFRAVLPLIRPLVGLIPTLANLFGALMRAIQPILPVATFLARIIGKTLVVAIRICVAVLGPLIRVTVTVIKWLSTLVRWITGGSPGLIPALQTLARVVRAVMSVVKSVWLGAFNAVRAAVITVYNTLRSVLAVIRNLVTAVFKYLRTVIIAAWNAIRAATVTVWNAIRAALSRVWATIRALITVAMGVVRKVITAGWNAVTGIVTAAIGVLRTVVGRLAGYFGSAARAAVTALKNAITSTVSGIGAWLNRVVVQPMNRGLRAIVNLARGIGGALIEGLKNGILRPLKSIGSWIDRNIVQPIVKGVRDFFEITSPSHVMEELGANVIKGFLKGIIGEGPLDVARMIFGSLPRALGAIVGKGLATLASLPKKAVGALKGLGSGVLKGLGWTGNMLSGIGDKIASIFPGDPDLAAKWSAEIPAANYKVGAGVNQWRSLMLKVLNLFGIPDLLGTFMSQMASESGGNPKAINLWDINAKRGIPSKGLMQVIDPTFQAYAGPFRSRGIWDPLANIYAAVAYALSRYGNRIRQVLGHGHGYALGGIIGEPVVGAGLRTGQIYRFAERGPERISPLSGMRARDWRVMEGTGGITIHVHPREQQSEMEIAAMVSRRLGWLQATGGGSR